jgi:transcriptional regulator with XRE-family HTH domain
MVSCEHVFHRYVSAVNLKQARKSKRLTQAALADMLGMHVRTIIRFETGNKLPRNRLLRERYCRILGLKAR